MKSPMLTLFSGEGSALELEARGLVEKLGMYSRISRKKSNTIFLSA
jgi:hypothetical protein